MYTDKFWCVCVWLDVYYLRTDRILWSKYAICADSCCGSYLCLERFSVDTDRMFRSRMKGGSIPPRFFSGLIFEHFNLIVWFTLCYGCENIIGSFWIFCFCVAGYRTLEITRYWGSRAKKSPQTASTIYWGIPMKHPNSPTYYGNTTRLQMLWPTNWIINLSLIVSVGRGIHQGSFKYDYEVHCAVANHWWRENITCKWDM